MLPGLMRTAATPASIALSARLALKWMSAITGSGENRTIRASASASFELGDRDAHDLAAGAREGRDLGRRRGTSWVFVSVIDCTTDGAPPPIWTPPT